MSAVRVFVRNLPVSPRFCAESPAPPHGPEPDLPDDPDRDKELPDVNPGSNPANPGDEPGVATPGRPARVVARSFRRARARQ